jgi:transposase
MVYPTDVLTNTQIAFLATRLPEPNAETGRPAYTNSQLLPGILRVLRSGCRWRDLDLPGYPAGITHWRRLRFWMRHDSLKILFLVLCKLYLRHERLQSLKRLSLDATFIPSFEFAEGALAHY